MRTKHLKQGSSSIVNRPSSPAVDAFAAVFDAYDNLLSSIRGCDGEPAEATELEKLALLNRIRKRLAVNAKMPPGYNGALTVQETARRLGVKDGQVYHLCREGRLNPAKVDGCLYIPPEEVRSYRRQQEIWAAQGGRWTPCGREEKKEPESPYKPAGPQPVSTPSTQSVPAGAQDRWLTSQEAGRILGLAPCSVLREAQRGRLESRPVPRGRGGGSGRPKICVSLESVMRLAEERESESWRRTIRPQEWNHDLRHPIVRTKIEAPPGDHLITVLEAAEILGVRRHRISILVASGRLFGWQTNPGKKGCPLYLSERQVLRYAEDPMRIKHRLARLEGSAPSELKVGDDWSQWRAWHGLDRYDDSHTDRDRGEFLSTYQAACVLGINPKRVRALRSEGRLRGYQRKPGRNSYWFFRRDDVEDLLADPTYAAGRRAYQKGLATTRSRQQQGPAIIYSRYRDQSER